MLGPSVALDAVPPGDIVSPMHTAFLGETFALLAAVTWAMALILFKLSGDRISPIALNLFKNTIGLVLLAGTLLVLGEGTDTLGDLHPDDIGILFLSGVIGITLADTVFLESLRLVGVGIVSIVDCLYSPLVILFSVLLLAETLSLSDYVGGALIISAVLCTSRLAVPANRTRRQLVTGILLGALAMALMAFGIVIAKPVLEVSDFPLIWAATLRLLVGTVALALIALASPARKKYWSVFRPSSVWKVSVPGSILGMYLAMTFWIAGFKYAQASIAAILNQTSVPFAIIFAAIFLKESLDRRKLMAMGLALAGVLCVTLAPL